MKSTSGILQMQEEIKIIGERIVLKKLSPKDATKKYCRWLNDPAINKWLVTRKTTLAQLQEYIKEKNNNPNCLLLGIFFIENQKHTGNIKLEPIDFKNSQATIGILIGDKSSWGKGIGGEAMKLVLNYAFEKLNLKKINLGVSLENKRAINLFKRIGFKTDHIEKNLIGPDRKLFSRLIMSIKRQKSSKFKRD